MSAIDIDALRKTAEEEITVVSSGQALEELRNKYLGRKGVLAGLTSEIPSLAPEERAAFGKKVNALKGALLAAFERKQASGTASSSAGGAAAGVDISMPGVGQPAGSIHLITQVAEEVTGLFARMGFSVEEGPEIENEFNNFSGLNIPLEHPSRDNFDTFYLKAPGGGILEEKDGKLLLRSHTSPMQIRVMRSRRPPVAVVVPGRVYRPDAVDASHSFMFNQIEGFLVDRNVNFSHLKGVLESFARGIFGEEISMRFRPHFFPFTEPSVELDVSCIICKGKGCPLCGRKGWLEILGAGMIHPNVFRNVGYEPSKYSGFAFGMGVDRIALLKYGIDDIRLLFQNDVRFLKQF
ncbi:MAG: phenylalanine--tRNA ligase subunit alpha [Elusimicrobia bacterium]|nr:phenylalanine--tRNA ligase subunit alpha [Elusimicrobiota bacterium]